MTRPCFALRENIKVDKEGGNFNLLLKMGNFCSAQIALKFYIRYNESRNIQDYKLEK